MLKSLSEIRNLLIYWSKHPLTRNDQFNTVKRFLKWQLGIRLLNMPVVWTWIADTKLVVEKGMTGATMNIYCGLHEFYDMAFVLHFLRSEDIFVDIGANVGSYSILASGVVGAKSITVEPIPSTYRKLERNVAINRLNDKVSLVMCGIGKEEGGILPFIGDQDTTNRVAPPNYQGKVEEVPIKNMDTLLFGIEPTMWKVDVEGFEEELLLGADKALNSEKLIAIEMEGDSPKIREILTSKGFELYHYEPFSRKLVKVLDNKLGNNWLWIRNYSIAETRCKEGKSVKVQDFVF